MLISTNIKITNVYKNVYVNNGVTVINRNTFATSSPRFARVDQNIIQQKIFVKNNISIGTPSIRPTRSSYFVSTKPIPQAKRPPQRVRDVHVKELKQLRPFVKTPEKSVLNPGARPKPLPLNTLTAPKARGKGKPMIQPVMPLEKEKPRAREVVPANRSIKRQVMPEERVNPVRPERTVPPAVMKKQVMPEEKEKRVKPEISVPPASIKKQVIPEERVKTTRPERTVPPAVMKKQVMPEEKEKRVKPEISVPPASIKKQVIPEERVKTTRPERTSPTGCHEEAGHA